MRFFDAHLDLAYLAECGRDMTSDDLSTCGGPHPPAAVTLASLRAGGVDACLGTIFTQGVPDPSAPGAESGSFAYPLGDAQAAHNAGVRQLERYHEWARRGLITLMPRRGRDIAPEIRAEQVPARKPATPPPLRVGILMECADPIRAPEELNWWVERGVVAIGLSWVHGGRYAAGNAADPADPGAGLTDLGRELVRAMDDLGVVHDLSHLSQRASDQLLEMTSTPVIASHSNARSIFPGSASSSLRQRQLSDETIREIARRDGVIGINLFSDFLDPSLPRGESASLEWLVRHAEHIAQVGGSRNVVGLGSDMDGGFSAARLPTGVRTPIDVRKCVAALELDGWSARDVRGWASENFDRFWRRAIGEAPQVLPLG